MKDPQSHGWISIADRFPSHGNGPGAYLISGHEWFGIGIWEDDKGWSYGFTGEWPYGDRGIFFDNEKFDPNDINHFLNQNVMWWKEIPDYPYYGRQMGELGKKFEKI